ncbi:MAG: peptide chain release factor N(5)-glutamine methyltransferase [Propionibacteriaceae bacterium]
MVEVGHVLREAERRLAAAGMASPAADARLLLAHTLEVEPARLLVLDGIDTAQHQHFADLVAERADGVPLQHLTGETTFRYSRLEVGPGAFVPRPETEVMTGWVLDRIYERSAANPDTMIRVVDLCTGSGAIVRALWDETTDLHDRLELHALELADDAIGYAIANLAGTAVLLHHADVADAAELLRPEGAAAPFDVVVANPPYIPLDAYESVTPEVRDHDPMIALFSGDDGLDTIHVVAAVAARLLRDDGWLACEHAEVQSAAVQQLVARTGDFVDVRDRHDLTDRPRFLTARRIARRTSGRPNGPASGRDAQRTPAPTSGPENVRCPLAGWTP